MGVEVGVGEGTGLALIKREDQENMPKTKTATHKIPIQLFGFKLQPP